MFPLRYFLCLAAMSFTYFQLGTCIECYQCDSNTDLECSELFDSKTTQLRPMPCNHVYEARFCIKTTGMYEGRIGTIRNCSARDLGDRCSYIKRPGDIRYIRSCVYTCTSGGCNAAVPPTVPIFILIPFSIFALLAQITYALTTYYN